MITGHLTDGILDAMRPIKVILHDPKKAVTKGALGQEHLAGQILETSVGQEVGRQVVPLTSIIP